MLHPLLSTNLRIQLTLRPRSVLVKDPKLFEDPETFDPSRFLTPQKPAGNWSGKVGADFVLPFGFGRRVCPGMHVALQSTFICMARCVPRVAFTPSLGEESRLVVTNDESTRQDFLGIRPASRRRLYH
jgi:cytochrome P450